MTTTKTTRNVVESAHRFGYSLIELLVVLAILMSTTVLVMPLFNPAVNVGAEFPSKTPEQVATAASLRAIHEAIVGENGLLENLASRPQLLPREISELVQSEAPARIKTRFPELTRFNPRYSLGWSGPYLQPTGKNRAGKPTLIDGWGNEFQLQIDFDRNGEIDENEMKYARIVSAGPNGRIDTPCNPQKMKPGSTGFGLSLNDCGDDLVIFLSIPDTRE